MSALVLHLELDGFEVVDKKEVVRDVSGHHHNGTLVGDVDLVADDTFGACASFDGTSTHHIAVPSTPVVRVTGNITVEAWVYIREERRKRVRVVGKGTKSSRSYGLWYHATGMTTTWLFQRGDGKALNECELTHTHTHSEPPLNTWYHVTGVVSETQVLLYLHDLQGKLIDSGFGATVLSGAPVDNDDPITIGYAPEPCLPHSGRIAHVRVHNGPRSQAEIEDDIGRDRLSLAPFRKSHPMDFRVHDDDDQAVLCISDDPAGHNLHLELLNTSTHALEWNNGHGGKASDSNHHVAVRFRPGALSDSVLKTLADPDPVKRAEILSAPDREEWDVYFPPRKPAANEASPLYLLYIGKNPTFQPNESRTLTFQKMSAAPGSGTRGTLVEFLPAQLTYTGADKTLITGARTQYVHITNQLGRKNIPLHVWLTKGNHVLNNGEKGPDLTLRISNGSTARDLILEKVVSKFLISFDVGDDDWALTDKKGAKDVEAWHGEEPLTVVPPAVGDVTTKEWEWKFSEKTVLAKRGESGKPLEVEIRNITTRSSGHANLYVRYEGIPGYQDGQFILTVVKSPLVYGKDGAVGIGTPAPKAPLHVNGSLRIDGGRTVVNGFDASGNHWVKTNGPQEAAAVFMAFIGAANGEAKAVQIAPGGASGGLFVRKDGHVGIGITDPKEPLHVKGNLRIDGDKTVVNGFDDRGRHWITTSATGGDKGALLAFIGAADGAATAVQIAPGGGGGGLVVKQFEDHRIRVGIGTDVALDSSRNSTLTINKNITHDANFDYSAAPLSIFLPIEKHNGGKTFREMEDILHLVREGVAGVAYGNKVSLAIGRYSNDTLNSYTHLDIKLTDGSFDNHKCVLSLRSNGHVGIGTRDPQELLHVKGSLRIDGDKTGNPKLQILGSQTVTGNEAPDSTYLEELYSNNRVNGIGISSNRIAAIGKAIGQPPSQNIYLSPKGNGAVEVEGDLQVNGVLSGANTSGRLAVISCPAMTRDKAKAVLPDRKHVVAFFNDGGNLNWMIRGSDGKAVWYYLEGRVLG